jgi:hypothetical protein
MYITEVREIRLRGVKRIPEGRRQLGRLQMQWADEV